MDQTMCATCGCDYLDCLCGEYVDARASDEWGAYSVTDADHADACARMDAAIDALLPAGITVTVRPAQRGEASGLYRDGHLMMRSRGALREALSQAWMHACQTWPVRAGGAS